MADTIGATTPIGAAFVRSQYRRTVGLVLMFATISADVWGAAENFADFRRELLAATAVLLMWLASGRDADSLGLRLTPLQPVRYWAVMTICIGLAMLAFFAVAIVCGFVLNVPMELPRLPPQYLWYQFRFACLHAPLQEEATYRLVLCCPLASLIGIRWTIVVSGFLFAALHVVYGNPGIDNAIARFILGWAYLKSGSIVVPIVLHSLGNAFVLAVHLAAWNVG